MYTIIKIDQNTGQALWLRKFTCDSLWFSDYPPKDGVLIDNEHDAKMTIFAICENHMGNEGLLFVIQVSI